MVTYKNETMTTEIVQIGKACWWLVPRTGHWDTSAEGVTGMTLTLYLPIKTCPVERDTDLYPAFKSKRIWKTLYSITRVQILAFPHTLVRSP